MNQQTSQVDNDVLNLAKAIRQKESGGNYSAVGDVGTSTGAFQFQPNTWKLYANEILGDSNAQMTKENQNAVVYGKIKKWKDSGWNAAQVAAAWNAGENKASSGDWVNNVGSKEINGQTVQFNTPQYVKDVMDIYHKSKNQGANFITEAFPKSQTQATEQPVEQSEDSLSGKLSKRVTDISGNVSDIGKILSGQKGDQSIVSDVLQAGGAVAGAVGDVVTKGLEQIPGVKWIEKQIGIGAGKLAQTEVGQSVVKSIQDFSQKHPELSKDIGAGFNIVTAIPILKGLGAVKDVAMTGVGKALGGLYQKGAVKDLTSAFSRTKTLSKALESNGGQKTLLKGIENGLIPDIEANRFNTQEVVAQTSDAIRRIEDTQLTPILKEVSSRQKFGQNLESLKNLAIKQAESDVTLREAGMVPQAISQIEKRFDGWRHSFGDNIDLATENRLKIGSGKFSDWGTPEGTADKAIYHALQHDIENVAKKNGLDNVAKINAEMAEYIRFMTLMEKLHGQKIHVGVLRKILGRASSATLGATVGSLIPGGGVIPEVVGGLIGEKYPMGLFSKKSIGGLAGTALKKNVKTGSVKKIGSMVGATSLQGINR